MTDRAWSEGLPSFSAPPVIEVAMGIEFVPIPGLTTIKLVELHRMWESEFPQVQEQPALQPSNMPIESGLRFNVGIPPIRLWMISASDDLLLQIQNDRIILNWRRTPGNEYPRYATLREKYASIWSAFSSEVSRLGIGDLAPVTAEVSFVNRVEESNSMAGLSIENVVSTISPTSILSAASDSVLNIRIPIWEGECEVGQQTVVAAFAQMPSRTVTLDLAARIRVEGMESSAITSALDAAHRSGVESFAKITTPEMHKIWGKR
ncbi:TIGR04255 family protein [Rhodococcus sp. 24CO]|uniref:TIGR04255 family protein n=1 Tax=Rhodococcus sp. 24CO TaxID=3117460 RepID=UPI003D335B1B